MTDPVPLGYITLRQARERYEAAWVSLGPQHPSAINDRQERFRVAFRDNEMVAIVRFPDREGDYRITTDQWDSEGFVDRVFLSDEIVGLAGWEAYLGRTPLVAERAFDSWLRWNRPVPPPNPAQYPVMTWPRWTFEMTLAWIATRNETCVRWQVSGWRRDNGLPDPSIFLSYVGSAIHEEELDDPAAYDARAAISEFRAVAGSGKIVASGMAARRTIADGRVVTSKMPTDLTSLEWQYGNLAMDALDDIDRWIVGDTTFTEIMLNRTEVMAVWPEEGATNDPTMTPGRPLPPRTPVQKPRRAPSGQQEAIMAYLSAECGRQRPDISVERLAAAVSGWATDPARAGKYQIGEMDRSAVHRFFDSPWWAWYQQQTAP